MSWSGRPKEVNFLNLHSETKVGTSLNNHLVVLF
jgi:hypothetical protein